MTESSEEWIASWEHRRKKGVGYFLLQWVLAFGMAGVLFNALYWSLGDRPFDIVRLLIKAVFVGLGVGAWVWFSRESRYQKCMQTKHAEDA